eukprot:tig00001094_g6993.t1
MGGCASQPRVNQEPLSVPQAPRPAPQQLETPSQPAEPPPAILPSQPAEPPPAEEPPGLAGTEPVSDAVIETRAPEPQKEIFNEELVAILRKEEARTPLEWARVRAQAQRSSATRARLWEEIVSWECRSTLRGPGSNGATMQSAAFAARLLKEAGETDVDKRWQKLQREAPAPLDVGGAGPRRGMSGGEAAAAAAAGGAILGVLSALSFAST